MNPGAYPRMARETLELSRTLRRPPAEIRRRSDRRLATLLARSWEVPFQAKRLARAGVAPGGTPSPEEARDILQRLAPVTKAELSAAGTAVFRGGRIQPHWRSSRSSGSTGEPFRVYYDPVAWYVLKHGVKLRARRACGLRARDRIAILDAIPVDEEGRRLDERAGRVRRLSILAEPERVARRLARFRPHAIYGLPSALLDVAWALPLDLPPPAPRLLFTSGELLRPETRRALADAYGARPLDIYGTSETKEIAWECEAGSLHRNEDVVRLEVLHEDGTPVEAGQEGDLVATVLLNHAMPLLRYRTGDRGLLLDGPCECDLPLPRMGVVTGRSADAVSLADGRRVSPYTFTTALETVPGLARYQVRQLAPARFDVLVLPQAGVSRTMLERRVRDALTGGIPGIGVVDVSFVERFERGPRAKFRVVDPLSEEPD